MNINDPIKLEDVLKFFNKFVHFHQWSKWEIDEKTIFKYYMLRTCSTCGELQTKNKRY